MINQQVFIHHISTMVPDNRYPQKLAESLSVKLIAQTREQRSFVERIYRGTAIENRYSVIQDFLLPAEEHSFFGKTDSFFPEPVLKKRNKVFIREANRLTLLAARDLLEVLNLDAGSVTHLITVSCTGFSAPGFDIHLVKQLSMDPGIHRFHLGFMGCYAAFPAMKLARDICLAHPESRVMVVNAELCTLHFQFKFNPELQIANAIFGDGISAALISADPELSRGRARLSLEAFKGEIIPGSEDDMAWEIGEIAFDMRLSAAIPSKLGEHINTVIDSFLGMNSLKKEEVDIWAIHPGGKAILEEFCSTMDLDRSRLSYSYEILRKYGNMSSATIMFLLHAILTDESFGNIYAAAFGPGLTIESGIMRKWLP